MQWSRVEHVGGRLTKSRKDLVGTQLRIVCEKRLLMSDFMREGSGSLLSKASEANDC